MNAQHALKMFLGQALASKRKRYVGFASKPKTQPKFLNAIYHELQLSWDRSKIIKAVPEDVSCLKGFLFSPSEKFGIPVGDISEFVLTSDDSFLVVSKDGRFGIHSPEAFIDDRVIIEVSIADA